MTARNPEKNCAGPRSLGLPVPDHVPRELIRDDLTYIWGREATEGDNPYHRSRELLDDAPPLFYTTALGNRLYDTPGIWMCTRHEDIQRIYQDSDTFSSKDRTAYGKLIGEPWQSIPFDIDPPDHSKYRMMLSPNFTPAAMSEMEPSIREMANGLIDQFIDKGECDFSTDFARHYPVKVFLALMGLPFSRHEDFADWVDKVLHTDNVAVRAEGMRAAVAYLRTVVAEKRARPEEDLTSRIVHGQIDGRLLTDDEIIGTLVLFFIAGLDTVAVTLCLTWRMLALHPEMQAELAGNPRLIPSAVEEFLRINPLGNASRMVKKDTVIRGVQIKQGEVIQALDMAGNFDPLAFEEPQTVDFERRPNRHFSFGSGPHLCLGAPLARRELRLALEEWFKRIPVFRVKDGAKIPAYPGLLSVPSLPLVWA